MTGSTTPPPLHGHCLCGAVRFTATGPFRPPVACHCNECRRFTGSYWTATAALRTNVAIEGEENLAWFGLHEHARRGFCARCGSSLFFDPVKRDYLAIAAGCLEKPTGLALAVHIWAPEAGDYYTIADDLPRFPDSNHGMPFP